MRKTLAVVACVLAAATACQSKHHPNPQASTAISADEKQAQAIVQACATKANFLTKPGRKAFYACVAPPGEAAAVQACATRALAKDGVLTKAARQRFEGDIALCIIPRATPTPKVTKK